MPPLDLRAAWDDLFRRRAALAPSLAPYTPVLEAWAHAGTAPPLSWDAGACRRCWEHGLPLAAEAALGLDRDAAEPLLGAALDVVGGVRPADADALARLAAAWDRGDVGPASLLPGKGTIGSLDPSLGVPAPVLAFLATATLRPLLEPVFAPCRAHLGGARWTAGACPFCGGPAAYADIVEDGRRILACHVCGGAWPFARLRCPFCGNEETARLGRLLPEDEREEGYAVATCAACHGYVKELDRRSRWNAGPALLEDWGSPHFDLVARRQGYWRPIPSLPELAGGG